MMEVVLGEFKGSCSSKADTPVWDREPGTIYYFPKLLAHFQKPQASSSEYHFS
jgi:hypothetical protein